MTFRHLKIFIEVARCGTMREAARQLYISQPSVSQAIRELEEHYNVTLFDRLSNRIYITEPGKLLLSYANQITQLCDNMESAMKNSLSCPKLRVGGSVTVGTVTLVDIIKKIHTHNPDIDIRVTIDNTTAIEQKVISSELDLAIVEGSLTNEDIVSKIVCRDELLMAVGKTHPFYSLEKVTLDMLESQPLISREQGSADRNQFEQLMNENNIHMKKKWCCTNTEAIKNAVINGLGIAIISRKLISEELRTGVIKAITVDNVNVKREFRLIYHKNKLISPQMKLFMDFALGSEGCQ
ncbi:MAG: LysR family transcriptional regulator [Oscillospiraceae bacterium]|nr:LysR family transcriptional regulator [Oscillospiraceae bacterium]